MAGEASAANVYMVITQNLSRMSQFQARSTSVHHFRAVSKRLILPKHGSAWIHIHELHPPGVQAGPAFQYLNLSLLWESHIKYKKNKWPR